MKLSKAILVVFILVLIVPIFSIIILSFQDTKNETFIWYTMILQDSGFINAFILSITVSSIVAFLSTIVSFFLALSWFDNQQRFYVSFVVVVFGLLPPDILALSVSKIPQLLGLYDLNLIFLCFGLVLYCIPFGILICWTRFYFIEQIILKSAKDLGMHSSSIVFKVISPLSATAIISCFLLSFLLSFNEYPRTYYLSGFHVLISEFLNGKLNSGTDKSIYAGGSLIVFLTSISVILCGMVYIISSSYHPNHSMIGKAKS